MKNRLILTLCITLLVGSYTNVKVNAATEEGITGISLSLSRIDNINTDIYMWTTDKVNLRTKADINSDIITTIDKREKVKVTPSIGEWTKVEYKGNKGYIYSRYLRFTELPSLEFTDEEIELMAKIVWLESRGESDLGSACVIRVIINRLLSINFPDNIKTVLSDTNAFSTWKLLNTANPTEREYEIIEETLQDDNYTNLLTDDTVYFSTEPRNNNTVAKIGSHYFCSYDD